MAKVPDECFDRAQRELVTKKGEMKYAAFYLYAYYCKLRNNETGECFPSLKVTANALGLNYSYASQLKDFLVEKEWIELTENGHIRLLVGFESAEKSLDKQHKSLDKPKLSGENVLVYPKKSVDKPKLSSEKSLDKPNKYVDKPKLNVDKPKPANSTLILDILTSPINQPINQEKDIVENHLDGKIKSLKKVIAELPKKKRIAQPTDDEFALMLSVFRFWRTTTNHLKAKLTPERGRAVLERIRSPIGFDLQDFKDAINGCLVSPHHQGANENRTVYDDLELICRTDQNLERFKGYNEKRVTNGNIESNHKPSKQAIERAKLREWQNQGIDEIHRDRQAGILDSSFSDGGTVIDIGKSNF